MSDTEEHGPAATNGDGEQPPKPVTIAFVLYPGFTALDIIGPFEVLAFVPGHDAVFVAAEPGPVTDDTGRCQLVAAASLRSPGRPLTTSPRSPRRAAHPGPLGCWRAAGRWRRATILGLAVTTSSPSSAC